MQKIKKMELKYDKQDQQGKAEFNERNQPPQEPTARSPGGPQTKTGHSTRQSTDRIITSIIIKKK
jgi:hypothetical protein